MTGTDAEAPVTALPVLVLVIPEATT